MIKFVINKDDSGQNVYKFVRKNLKRTPLSLIDKLIRVKKVTVNGKVAEKKQILFEKDILEIDHNSEYVHNKSNDIKEKMLSSSFSQLNVVFEDDNKLIVNKPSGLSIHDGANNLDNDVINYLNKKGFLIQNQSFIPSHIHRIDKETSGLVVYSKNKQWEDKVRYLIKNKSEEFQKFYLALITGRLPSEHINVKGYINENINGMFFSLDKINDKSKECETVFKEIKYYKSNNESLIECKLKTGRKHQIRATLNFLKKPIIGDKKYGGAFNKEMCLCAYKIILEGKEIGIKPSWMKQF